MVHATFAVVLLVAVIAIATGAPYF